MINHTKSHYLRIGHANIKNNLRGIRVARSYNACSWGFSEASRRLRALGALTGYRTFYGEGGRDKRRGATDTPIITKRAHHSVGTIALLGAEQARPIRIAPDRWITVSIFEHNVGRVAHINIHPHAAVKNLTEQVERVREFGQMMALLGRVITFLKATDFHVVLTGDVNFPVGARSPGWPDPYEVFRSENLRWRDHGIDCIAWTRGLEPVGQVQIIPQRRLGSDHDGMFMILRRS